MSERTWPADGAPAAAPERSRVQAPDGAEGRREQLKDVYAQARGCVHCPQLVAARSQVIFGGGSADADLMLVCEAPGAREDEEGQPLVGAAGALLDELLAFAGLSRAEVFLTFALKCRPPGNRDPSPAELGRCRDYLEAQIELVQPRVIVTLGASAARAVLGGGVAVADVHGQAHEATIGRRAAYVVPLFHPAAALYTRALLETLREDFARIPELLARPAIAQPRSEPEVERGPAPGDEQLGLF